MGEYSKSAIIKYTRKSLGITQEELSESVCDPVTLSRYESGKIDPSDSKFLRLMEKMGEKGSTFIFQLETSLLEVEDESEKLNKAIEQHDWEEAERIKNNLIQNNNFNLDYFENRQYLQWVETIIQYEQGMINERQVIEKLEEAWSYTCGNINTEEFNMNRIYRETEIIILHEIAIFYKLLGKLDKACVFYENLIKYFERADMVNETKPIYLIYIGYSNILGVMGEHEKSMEICFKAIKRGLAENKMNYLYNFYYNIGCSLQIKGNDEEKRLAKLYIWTAYQLCQAYPENKRNLEIIKRRYEQFD